MKKTILLLITCFFCITSSAWAAEAYVVKSTDGQTLTFYYDNYKSSRSGTIYSLNTGDNSPEWVPEWDPESSSPIRWVEFNSSFANARPTTTNQWFYIFSYLLSIQSIQYLNTQNVTNMSAMFYHCDHLPSLDLSNFDTRNVTNMSAMFAECNQLRSLDVSNFDTRNVTDMSGMFARCVYLRSLDLSNFDTRNVTDMSGMFASCGLRSLDLSNFDTRNVTDMSRMFSVCQSLTNLNVGNFDTRNVTDMSRMFQGCNLTSLDLSNFDTRNVTNMSSMFLGCSGGTNFKVTNFNTSNVTTMKEMFAGCSGLTSLDLSNFDMSKVTSSSSMLGNCSSLKSLSISPTMENIASNACSGVGTETNPCVIYAPKGFDFGVDTSGDYFIWKGGFFTLGKQEYEGMIGDVNNDGVVSISDAICIISWLQENTLPVFIEGAADYNKDGSITVSDALAIIQMLLTLEPDPVIPDIPDDDISQLIPTTSAKGVDINLSNEAKYTAFTMDVALPEGMTVNDISLDTRRAPRHQLVSNRLSDGRYRIIGFSPTLDSFYGNNGTLLTIKTNKKGTGKIGIDNIHFVDLNAQEYSLNASHGNTTGIDIVNSEMKVYVNGSNIIVEADKDMDVNVYTVSGLLYKTLGVKAGRNVFSGNDAGIYIVNGVKLIIK